MQESWKIMESHAVKALGTLTNICTLLFLLCILKIFNNENKELQRHFCYFVTVFIGFLVFLVEFVRRRASDITVTLRYLQYNVKCNFSISRIFVMV